MSESDEQRERDIDEAYLMMAAPNISPAKRRKWQARMLRLCTQRSDEQKARMEREKNERIRRGG